MSKVQKKELWEENRAFFQANTIKGGRYLDDSGKIINEYVEAYKDLSVGLNGLRLGQSNNADMPDEIVVDINRVWLACYGQGCIKKIKESAEMITKTISRHIGVDLYSRLGLRVYYYKSMDDIRSYMRGLYSRLATPELQTVTGPTDKVLEMISCVRFMNPPFSIRLNIQPITILRPPEKTTDFVGNGVVIDIDVYEDKDSSKRPLNPKHIAAFLRESSDRVITKAGETIALLNEVE